MRPWCPLWLLTGKGASSVIDVRVDGGKLRVRLSMTNEAETRHAEAACETLHKASPRNVMDAHEG
jgi:hypothetical protein